jgi:hypothetical protein
MSYSIWAPSSPKDIEFFKPEFDTDSLLGPAGMGSSGPKMSFKTSGGSSPLDPYGSGLEGLNDLNQFPIPTYSQDPFYYQNVMNQQKNMDPNGYWTGPKEHKPIVKVNDEWKFLKNLTPAEKAIVSNTSKRFGEGIEENFGVAKTAQSPASVKRAIDAIAAAGSGMTGGPLSLPDISRQDVQRATAAAERAPAAKARNVGFEYAKSSKPTVSTGKYRGMSYGL